MSQKEVYWHLPGFCELFYLNQTVVRLMQDFPDKFRSGYRIGSVYGTFPGAIWNGGRAVFGIISKGDMEKIIGFYNSFNIPVRFTWTNSILEEKHLNDTYCNLIMSIADNGKNQVLVNTKVLEEYLRAAYPNFEYISSTTKRLTDVSLVEDELNSDYKLVVLDYDLNHNEKVLKQLEPFADRIEILVDEICYAECPKRKDHYKDESLMQLNFDRGTVFDCPNRKTKPSFAECRKRPQFIGNDTINDYIDRGYVNFKLVGRGLPIEMVVESYLYYLVNDADRSFVKEKIMNVLGKAGRPV